MKIKPIADFLVVCIELKLKLMKLNDMAFRQDYTLKHIQRCGIVMNYAYRILICKLLTSNINMIVVNLYLHV
jgi:hypothetical protein